MADETTSDTPAKKPARRRSTTPAKSVPAASVAKSGSAAPKAEPKKAKSPPKPRAAKRSTPVASSRSPSKVASAGKKATDKIGGKWGAAAIAGGLAAAGAAAAALLTLRGSTSKPGDPAKPKDGKAHQPDGTDSTASFDAKIADENTVPDKL